MEPTYLERGLLTTEGRDMKNKDSWTYYLQSAAVTHCPRHHIGDEVTGKRVAAEAFKKAAP